MKFIGWVTFHFKRDPVAGTLSDMSCQRDYWYSSSFSWRTIWDENRSRLV